MRILILFLVLFLIFSSCNSKKETAENVDIEVITVKAIDESQKHEFYDYFDSKKLIALQTTKESVIGKVGRVVMALNKIFILDRQSKSILVFNDVGGFEYKIQNLGKGRGEYISLMDFTFDETKRQLIVHSDRPGKLIYYDLNGKFISEEATKSFFYNISSSNDNLIVLPPSNTENRVLVKNFLTNEDQEYLPYSKAADRFRNFGLGRPQIVKSKFPYITFEYCDTIFQFHNELLKPKYRLDFGNKALPAELLNNPAITSSQIAMIAYQNGYSYGISNFRENDSFITFSYAKNMVLYSKRSKKAITLRGFHNSKDFMHFYGYFAHDGDDDTILGLYQPGDFIKQMQIYEADPYVWKKIPAENKKIYKSLDELSNPLLLICKFKN